MSNSKNNNPEKNYENFYYCLNESQPTYESKTSAELKTITPHNIQFRADANRLYFN